MVALADHFFRNEYGRVLGSLSRWLGSGQLELAEDAVQEALSTAVRMWPLHGIPRDPTAWLVRVARNHALDAVRRAERHELKLALAARSTHAGSGTDDMLDADLVLPDDQLELMLLCCHPVLRRSEQVALTLKVVAGFGTEEVARAFVVPVPTVAQRIVRAKRRLRDADVQLAPSTTAAAAERVPAVLDVLYLIFNEGYSFEEATLRVEVAAEAERLVQLLAASSLGDRPDVHALAALVLLQSSRLQTRIDGTGAAVALREQDRSQWDRERIDAGLAHLAAAGRGERLTDFHLLAAIAACHAAATSEADTDWGRIAGLYDELAARSDSPVVRLNRAVAVSMASGPAVGLRLVDELARDGRSPAHLVAAARADCLRRLGSPGAAAAAWHQAMRAAPSVAERLAFAREADADRAAAAP